MKKCVLLLLLACLMAACVLPGLAWAPDAFFDSRAQLPQAVNQRLDELFAPGEEMISAHRQGKAIYLLSENQAEERRVFIFLDEGAGYHLDVMSQPLAAIDGHKPTIGSGGELYLMYQSNYCFYRVNGKWLLYHVQFVDEYSIFSHCMKLNYIKGMTLDEQPATIGRYTDERDLSRITASDLPVRYADAWALFDRVGYAVVSNPDPNDRLHLRKNPSQRADSLGKFYNGTVLQVKEKKGEWWRVSIGHLQGWMMHKYLVQGEAMDQVKTAFPALDLKEGKENALRFTTPEGRADKVLSKDWPLVLKPRIIGVYEDDWFILMNSEGQLYYQKQAWFWEGNG